MTEHPYGTIVDLTGNEAPVPEPLPPITPEPLPPVTGERCQWRTVNPFTQCTGTAAFKAAPWCDAHRCSVANCTNARVVGTVCVGHMRPATVAVAQ